MKIPIYVKISEIITYIAWCTFLFTTQRTTQREPAFSAIRWSAALSGAVLISEGVQKNKAYLAL